jgi:hypothetical protein
MAIPSLNNDGELPPGIWPAAIDEVLYRFGEPATRQRIEVTDRLRRIWSAAASTGELQSVLVFGSYVTDKPEPNDVDVILIMKDAFRPIGWPAGVMELFDHAVADSAFGASVFWIRPGLLILDTIEEFKNRWQRTRAGHDRGIVEIFA